LITFDCTDNSVWEPLAPPTHFPLPMPYATAARRTDGLGEGVTGRDGRQGLHALRSSTRTGSPIQRSGAVVAMIAPSGRSGVG
jgi:hypothetical protein